MDVDKQGVLDWVNRFRNIMELCRYDEKVALGFLKLSIGTKYAGIIENKRSLEQAFSALTEQTYNPKAFEGYLTELSRIKVGQFRNIRDYVKKFDSLIDDMGRCVISTERLTLREKESYLKAGLAQWMREEMIRLGRRSIQEKLEILAQIEEERRRFRPMETKGGRTSGIPKKWCPLHRSNTHSELECFTLKNRMQTKKNSKDENFKKDQGRFKIIKEVNSAPKRIVLKGTINEEEVDLQLDTGATGNFITDNQAENMKLVIDPFSIPIELGNGETIQGKGEVSFEVEMLQIPGTFYRIRALVIPGKGKEIILGMKFLSENGAMLDLEQGLIRIDGRDIEMPKFEGEFKTTPEGIIAETFKGISENNESLNEIIKMHRLSNPKTGNIKGYYHEIELKDEIVVQEPSYGIPFKLYDRLKEEVENLKNEGIIRTSTSKYSSPSFVLEKKNGNLRLITDFKKLNEKVKKEAYHFQVLKNKFLDLKMQRYLV